MTPAEARLSLHQTLQDLMVDLAVEEEMSAEELDEVEESMAELVEMLLDSIRLKIVEVHKDHVVAHIVFSQ